MSLGWGPKEKRALRRESRAFFKELKAGKDSTPVLSSYPKYFAEAMAMLLDDIPDLIAYRTPEDVGRFMAAYDLAIGHRIPNTRKGFERLQVSRGELFGSILIGPVDGLCINDVKGQFVAGDIPHWLAMHAKWVIVFEPDIPKMCEGAFVVSNELRSPVKYRLAAYDVFRKTIQALGDDRQPIFDDQLKAVEAMTISQSTHSEGL